MLAAEKRRGEVLKQVLDCNCSICTMHGLPALERAEREVAAQNAEVEPSALKIEPFDGCSL